MQDRVLIAQLVIELLSGSANSSELGARLKQRLNSALVDKGLPPLNEKALGFKRFSDFLLDLVGDKISIERPLAAGDISVVLRGGLGAESGLGSSETPHGSFLPPVIRSDVWQAFTNPNRDRRRFLHKETYVVRHFLDTEASAIKDQVSQDQGQYLEIQPIDSGCQQEWMKGFLESLRLAPAERAPLDAIVADAYSSSVNATFTRALGDYGAAWRKFRTNKVSAAIQDWATCNGLAFDNLCVQKEARPVGQQPSQSTMPSMTPRQQVIKLLELLSDEDVSRLVLPTLLSTILIKSRL